MFSRALIGLETLNSSDDGTFVTDERGLQTTEFDFNRTGLIGDVVESERAFLMSGALAREDVEALKAFDTTVEDDLAECLRLSEHLILTAAQNLLLYLKFAALLSPALGNVELNLRHSLHLLLLLRNLQLQVVRVRCGNEDHF